jgi:hypothetical protein
VSRSLSIVAAAALTGCFYTSPINERPSTTLDRVTPVTTPYLGDPVTIEADSIDPDGDAVRVDWTAQACDAGGVGCGAPFRVGTVDSTGKFTFTITAEGSVGSVRVAATTTDSYGAPALQEAVLVIDVANRAPTVTTMVASVAPPDGPTIIDASAVDAEDGLDVTYGAWTIVDAPFPNNGTLVKVSDNADDLERTTADERWRLIPDVEGTWTIGVTVTDLVGTTTTVTQPILIGTDRPPCLVDVAPALPSPGNTLPLDQPRRFEVLVVDDDLDLFPWPSPDDPFYGPAEFQWSISSPATGGEYVAIPGGVDSYVELDPAAYEPDDAVFLRVEIADRVARTLPCPDGDLSCAIDPAADPPCVQRQTWAIEVQP